MQSPVQYQHYIPRFILRNFSHRYKPPKRKGSRNCEDPPGEKHLRKGDDVLNVVDLASDGPQLREAPVARWFGQENMYDGAADIIKSEKNVEEKLQRLESRAAAIFLKVRKAHDSGEPGIILDRSELDRLRKFLFVMKYRGPGYFDKYVPDERDSYQWEDKNILRSYMFKKGFRKPRDVWLHNLHAILDLDMDAQGEWMKTISRAMFPADAEMFVTHVKSSYTTFCTPRVVGDEFILTDNCYNLMEGPIHESTSATTGENLGSWRLCFHEFFPISARLIIVLRSLVLPEALEDANPEVRHMRRNVLEGAAAQLPNPENVKSILADLPVSKATNSYTVVVNGQLRLEGGATRRMQSRDKFTFRFWSIERRHVDIINTIFFDNVLECTSIVFRSVAHFTRSLEEYMTSNLPGFKNVGVGERHARFSRRICLEKLFVVLKALGSNKVPIWREDHGASKQATTFSLDDVWLNIFKITFRNTGRTTEPGWSAFFEAYCMLDGTRDTFLTDLEQSWRLYQLYARVSNFCLRLSEQTRQRAGNNIVDLILQFHPRRIWLFVKHQRWMFSGEYARFQKTWVGTAPILAAKTKALMAPQREDEFVRANRAASHEYLSKFIYEIGAIEIRLRIPLRGD